MEKFIKETPGSNSSANKGSGADNKIIGDSLEQIQVGLKLVPNMDQHNFLLKLMSQVPNEKTGESYTGLESSVEYDTKALGE